MDKSVWKIVDKQVIKSLASGWRYTVYFYMAVKVMHSGGEKQHYVDHP